MTGKGTGGLKLSPGSQELLFIIISWLVCSILVVIVFLIRFLFL